MFTRVRRAMDYGADRLYLMSIVSYLSIDRLYVYQAMAVFLVMTRRLGHLGSMQARRAFLDMALLLTTAYVGPRHIHQAVHERLCPNTRYCHANHVIPLRRFVGDPHLVRLRYPCKHLGVILFVRMLDGRIPLLTLPMNH